MPYLNHEQFLARVDDPLQARGSTGKTLVALMLGVVDHASAMQEGRPIMDHVQAMETP